MHFLSDLLLHMLNNPRQKRECRAGDQETGCVVHASIWILKRGTNANAASTLSTVAPTPQHTLLTVGLRPWPATGIAMPGTVGPITTRAGRNATFVAPWKTWWVPTAAVCPAGKLVTGFALGEWVGHSFFPAKWCWEFLNPGRVVFHKLQKAN